MARSHRNKTRRRRRRGRFAFLYRFISVVLAAAALLAACLVFFRIDRVTVEGNARYTAQEIADASGIRQGDNLIALPKGRIANRILLELPYVAAVSIHRAFPDGAVLVISEHTAAAAVEGAGGWWYISAQGKLLEQSDAPGPLRISGITAVEPAAGEKLTVAEEERDKLSYVLSLLAALEKQGMLSDCAALDCAGTGYFSLAYRNFTLKIPTTGDYSRMFLLLEEALQSGKVSAEEQGTFDFTITEGRVYYNRTS